MVGRVRRIVSAHFSFTHLVSNNASDCQLSNWTLPARRCPSASPAARSWWAASWAPIAPPTGSRFLAPQTQWMSCSKLELHVWPTLLSLPTYIPIYLPTYLPTYIPTYLPSYLPSYQPTNLPTYLSTYLPTNPLTYLPTFLPTNLPIYLPTYLPNHLYNKTFIWRATI